MSYCTIEYTTGYYDSIFPAMKMIQVEKDVEFGDVFDDYIICNQGNPLILDDINSKPIIKCGMYAQLTPICLIKRLRSDRSDIKIEGFERYKKQTKFYPALGFEIDGCELGAEIIDNDENKATVVTDYYYIRKY